MSMRRRSLPSGWYPSTAEAVRRQIEEFKSSFGADRPSGSLAGIVPHAGWFFSGAMAAEVFGALDPEAETIVVVGGHLGRSDHPVAAPEEAYATPLGPLAADLQLREALGSKHALGEDDQPDNTVEVQLPLVRYLFPASRALALRAPPHPDSGALGEALERAAAELGRRIVVVGSTDLTHYGPNYGFTPHGTGPRALRWVREENDAAIIRAFLALEPAAALEAATLSRAACSAGGALAAMGFARARGVAGGRLLRYATSHDLHPDDSFVGYAGIVFP